jgi:sulfite reductase (NADPH) hemoprotein beta-component
MSDTKISPTQYDAVTHTDVERIKVQSDYLRGSIKDGLIDPITGSICDDDQVLIKFHGIYQQDDRDLRNDRRKAKLEPLYAFMIRARVPGGVASSGQYQVLAELAKKYSNGSLRLTTRQAFQWHGVFKRNLKRTIAGINSTLLDTVAACGDVNRNVMATSLPETSEIHQEVYQWAKKLSEHLLPKSNAFHEIWLDGEKVESTEEPIYGKTYLPRKFKTAIAIPPNNDVDVYANDLGFIAIIDQQKLIGFNVLVGGGMGTAHNDSQTYPRVADVIGFCTPDKLLEVAESVVRLQRDYGDRKVRKLARLKYTIDRLGIDQFKSILSDYLGWSLAGAKSFEFSGNGDRYGWLKTENDKWHLTLYIHSGRIVDSPQSTLFSGLLAIADIHQGEFSNITPETKQHIQSLISQHGISFGSVETPVRLNSVACVAFPTCSLAMAEAERYLPDLISKIEVILDQYNLLDQPINIRMTGCPNGCARPFLGEIGFVGKAPGKYNLYLGASFKGDRLNKLYKENINEQQILDELNPLFKDYADQRSKGEFFGDFVIRKGYIRPVVNGLDFHG